MSSPAGASLQLVPQYANSTPKWLKKLSLFRATLFQKLEVFSYFLCFCIPLAFALKTYYCKPISGYDTYIPTCLGVIIPKPIVAKFYLRIVILPLVLERTSGGAVLST